MRRTGIRLPLFGALIAIGVTLLMSSSVFAADYTSLMDKWIMTQYRSCLVDFTTGINDKIARKTSGKVLDSVFRNSGTMYMPSYDLAGKTSLTCRQVAANGGLSIGQSVWDAYGGGISSLQWSSLSEAQDLMTDVLKYNGISSTGEGKFKVQATREIQTELCTINIFTMSEKCNPSKNEFDSSTPIMTISAPNSSGKRSLSVSGWDNFWSDLKLTHSNSEVEVHLEVPPAWLSGGMNFSISEDHSRTFPFYPDREPQDLYDRIKDDLPNVSWYLESEYYPPGGMTYTISRDIYTFGVGDLEIVSHSDYDSFEFPSNKVSDAVKKISKNKYSSYSDMILTNTEKYALYIYYLDKIAVGSSNNNRMTCNPTDTTNLTKVKLLDAADQTFKDCYVNLTTIGADALQTTMVYTQTTERGVPHIEAISLQTMLDWLNAVDETSIDTSLVDATVDSNIPVSGENPDSGQGETTCANSGGAMSLGWIVCPILEWLGRASTEIYENYVEPSLQVEPQLFQNNSVGRNATKDAWGTFQSIANIVFIILFLIVIFSQLTGVGIDNYGIKRVLPKMIIAALLINLSYYICVICVDISNIVGNGLQELFNGLPVPASTVVVENSNANLSTVGTTAVTGVVILGALAVMVGSIWANPAILLSLLVGALGVMIAIFFLFILLAAREAAIVVLVVLSPLAFACYMLPNTKKMFDRWVKMGQGLLLVYPICGLLVGGGDYVSRLLLSSGFAGNGFVTALTAMIVGILPIFFIPMVLKTSFAAMGNLGAKISGFGDRVRGGADRKIRSAEGYKNAQRMGLERRTRIKAGLDKDGNLTARGERKATRARSGFGRLTGADKRQAAYIAMARKDMASGEQADASLTNALARTGIASAAALPDSGSGGDLGSSFAASTEGAYYGRQFLDAASASNISGMNAAIEAMRSSGMKSKDIAKLMRYAQNKGHFNGLNSNTKAAWLRDTAKRYGNDFLATDFELSSWAQAGGSLNGGVLGGYGDLAASGEIKMDDIKPEDVGKLSGDSLAGMAMAGLIDQSMAQRAIVSNPNLSVDKKIMLSAIANGAANSSTITSIQDFKSDAEQLMKNHANTVGLKTMNAVTEAMVDAWASVTPDSVNVVQNFEGGGRQIDPVEVQIRGNNPNPPASSGGGLTT